MDRQYNNRNRSSMWNQRRYDGRSANAAKRSAEEYGFCADNDSSPVMVTISKHELRSVYEPEEALCRGTLFPELDKPFMRGGSCYGK